MLRETSTLGKVASRRIYILNLSSSTVWASEKSWLTTIHFAAESVPWVQPHIMGWYKKKIFFTKPRLKVKIFCSFWAKFLQIWKALADFQVEWKFSFYLSAPQENMVTVVLPARRVTNFKDFQKSGSAFTAFWQNYRRISYMIGKSVLSAPWRSSSLS